MTNFELGIHSEMNKEAMNPALKQSLLGAGAGILGGGAIGASLGMGENKNMLSSALIGAGIGALGGAGAGYAGHRIDLARTAARNARGQEYADGLFGMLKSWDMAQKVRSHKTDAEIMQDVIAHITKGI